MASWQDLPVNRLGVPTSELALRTTLDCGQAFRWSADTAGAWIGVIGKQVFRLYREAEDLCWQAFPSSESDAEVLARYLRLDVRLADVIDPMAARDEHLARAVRVAQGLRVLAQDPEETLCSYMCSAANSVPRISQAIAFLSAELGDSIGTLEGLTYSTFPGLDRLSTMPPYLFEASGLGFRGEHLRQVARQLLAKPPDWGELRALAHDDARDRLSALTWVGPKIADCVCLFSLGHDDAVPVDTHVWALARSIFRAEIPTRSLTASTYRLIERLFAERYGDWAGWAQEYLFHWRRQTLARAGLGPPVGS
jgi:N-glycosylase/DNA lyase